MVNFSPKLSGDFFELRYLEKRWKALVVAFCFWRLNLQQNFPQFLYVKNSANCLEICKAELYCKKRKYGPCQF